MTNITQQESIEIAKEAGLEISGEFLGEPAYVAIESMIVTFAQLIEARLAARSDDRQSGEVIAWANKDGGVMSASEKEHLLSYEKYGGEFAIAARTAQRYDRPLAAPQQAIPAEVKGMFKHGIRAFQHKLDGDIRFVLAFDDAEKATEESKQWRDVVIFPDISNESIDAMLAAPTAPIDNVRDEVIERKAYERVAKLLESKANNIAEARGRVDYSTNALEFSSHVAEDAYNSYMEDAEEIRALIPSTQAPNAPTPDNRSE